MLLADIGRHSTYLDGRANYDRMGSPDLSVRIVPTDDPTEVEAEALDYQAATVPDVPVVGAMAGMSGTGAGSSVDIRYLLACRKGTLV